MSLFRRAFDLLEEARARSIARRLGRFLSAGQTVLDLGAGSMIVAAALERALGVRAFGLETLAYRRRPLPLALYAGRRAPFRDQAFDVVLIAFVLHHASDGGLAVLEEARRLTRSRILLLEDSFDTFLDRLAIRVVDPVLNWLENPRIEVPCRFRPTAEWQEVFHRLGLRLTDLVRIRTTPFIRTRQVLFVLEKEGPGEGAARPR
jgi:SAM-dependent methyltransferase